MAVVAIAAICGAPGGPAGVAVAVTIGAIVFGILCGFGVRWALNKKFEEKFKNNSAMDIRLKEEALKFFFDDKNMNIDDA